MNRRSFLLGTAVAALAPIIPAVAAPRTVGFHPALAAPYRIIPTREARKYLDDDIYRYLQMYRCHFNGREMIHEHVTAVDR